MEADVRIPFVSVIISAYNAEKFISEAIESVLDQSYRNFELILIDDGSTDDTLDIMKSFTHKDERIVIDAHENMGMGNSVNRAMKNAKGELIARMDADDIMLKNRIGVQVDFLNRNPDISMASCLTELIGENGREIGLQNFPQNKDLLTKQDTKRYVREKKCIHFAHTGIIFRKKDILNAGGYQSKYWPSDDIELFNRIADHGHGVVIIPMKLMKYRLHGSSIITSKFYTSTMKSHWVEDCIFRRRSGETELTFDEYLQLVSKESLYNKIRNLGNSYFRNAGIEFSKKNYIRFFYLTMAALILRPINVSKRMISKIIPTNPI